jgi:glycolate oxidase FAD binding subunit
MPPIQSPEDVALALRQAHDGGVPLERLPGLSRLDRVLEHVPEDMTVTVQSGITVASLQAALAAHGQWVPIDPPFPGSTSVAALLDDDLSGPRRLGYGTVRDHVIGLRAALPDGSLIRSGGRVVKNVAGYDLMKLLIGARASLGVIVEVTFKLLPLPEAESVLACECDSVGTVQGMLDTVSVSPLTPVILDWHRPGPSGRTRLVVGFAGSRESVAWEAAEARQLGFDQPADTRHDRAFWEANGRGVVVTRSVLPSAVAATVEASGPCDFVARAGNGVVFLGNPPAAAPAPTEPHALARRVKELFDPRGVLPPLPS